MKYKVGKYIIIKHSLWTISDARIINIVGINNELYMVKYFYDCDSSVVRERCFVDFDTIDLIECTPLIEELL